MSRTLAKPRFSCKIFTCAFLQHTYVSVQVWWSISGKINIRTWLKWNRIWPIVLSVKTDWIFMLWYLRLFSSSDICLLGNKSSLESERFVRVSIRCGGSLFLDLTGASEESLSIFPILYLIGPCAPVNTLLLGQHGNFSCQISSTSPTHQPRDGSIFASVEDKL